MTLEQMLTISKRAAAVCAAGPYRNPEIQNGVWTVASGRTKQKSRYRLIFQTVKSGPKTIFTEQRSN
jgi:hypothetical protein